MAFLVAKLLSEVAFRVHFHSFVTIVVGGKWPRQNVVVSSVVEHNNDVFVYSGIAPRLDRQIHILEVDADGSWGRQ